MRFEIIDNPGLLRVRFDGGDVLKLVNGHCLFRDVRINNLRTRPHGPVECISLMNSCCYGAHFLRAKICATRVSDHEVRIVITPETVAHDLDRIVHETRTITLRYHPETGRIGYEIRTVLRFLQDVPPQMPFLAITAMPQWGGDDYAVIEFDDPMLAGGVGPQVPMTQDWQGLQEPWFDEHCFTTHWRKRYTHAILQTAERGWRKIMLNKTVTSAQQFYNRHLLRCVPRSTFYYPKSDGHCLAIRHDYPQPCGHHICEWGMDMHCYALFERADAARLFAAGREIAIAYRIEEIDGAAMPAAAATAPAAELEPDELKLADAPLYEEPCCRFTASTLDHPDAQAWRLEGSGFWLRHGARQPDAGALVIDNARPANACWRFGFYGPSRACNPIPPLSRHGIAAWVKATDIAQVALELHLTHFNGPGSCSSRQEQVFKVTAADIIRSEGDWHYLERVTEPCGSYVLCGALVFRYCGAGQAWFSELSVHRL